MPVTLIDPPCSLLSSFEESKTPSRKAHLSSYAMGKGCGQMGPSSSLGFQKANQDQERNGKREARVFTAETQW